MRKVLFFIAFFCAFSVFASISVNFQQVKLNKAIMHIAKAGKISVITPANKWEPSVSVNFVNVNPLNAIRALCKTFNLEMIRIAGIYIVRPQMRKPMPTPMPMKKFKWNSKRDQDHRRINIEQEIRKMPYNKEHGKHIFMIREKYDNNRKKNYDKEKCEKENCYQCSMMNKKKNFMHQKNEKIKQNIHKIFKNLNKARVHKKMNLPINILAANANTKTMSISVGNRKVVLKEGQSYKNEIKLLQVIENNRVLVYYPQLMIRKIEKIK